jgi:hypothetical protein
MLGDRAHHQPARANRRALGGEGREAGCDQVGIHERHQARLACRARLPAGKAPDSSMRTQVYTNLPDGAREQAPLGTGAAQGAEAADVCATQELEPAKVSAPRWLLARPCEDEERAERQTCARPKNRGGDPQGGGDYAAGEAYSAEAFHFQSVFPNHANGEIDFQFTQIPAVLATNVVVPDCVDRNDAATCDVDVELILVPLDGRLNEPSPAQRRQPVAGRDPEP